MTASALTPLDHLLAQVRHAARTTTQRHAFVARMLAIYEGREPEVLRCEHDPAVVAAWDHAARRIRAVEQVAAKLRAAGHEAQRRKLRLVRWCDCGTVLDETQARQCAECLESERVSEMEFLELTVERRQP